MYCWQVTPVSGVIWQRMLPVSLVKVTGAKTGYKKASKTSKATAKVR